MDKSALRECVWNRLEDDGLARFPFPPHGRISNFKNAAAAAERALELPELADADAVKANPDSPQLPLRRGLLTQGTTVYMAVPRLRDERCFVALAPAELDDLDAAPTVSHMDEYGRQVRPEALPELDAIVVGSVAVTESGSRVGKGEGFSDLEYAILRERGLVGDETTVVTTIHEVQLIEEEVETARYDVPIDVICTPKRTIRTDAGEKPDGIFWASLSEESVS
ncbi:MAG: 5-formyltetrahydrofolate cyclo-ligase [Natronomonas sp.]|jgi:5-formyltetrahydrofolate cyclo-ligase|uniref:5-formyltetrahydrofolate cyclo-ligase n=2 Tax=Natronomonas sp. TaxID=2184060 RepID=UPI003989FD92